MTDLERFNSKTKPGPNGCIEWQAGKDKDGYGKFATGPYGKQKHHRAHRWIFEHLVEPLGDRLLRHSCDNPACVNVEHLDPGTQLDNVHDAMERKRRTQMLTEAIVLLLRDARRRGESVRALAKDLGVSYDSAIRAAQGRTWRHLPC